MFPGPSNFYSVLVQQTNEQVWQQIEAGQFQEALEVAQGTLERARKYVPVVDQSLQNAIFNLATIYHYLEEYDQAEPLFRELKELEEKIYHPDQPYLTGTASSLAKVYWSSGKYAEAQLLLEKALEIRRRIFHEKPSAEASYSQSLKDLVDFYQDIDRPDLAGLVLREVQAYDEQSIHRQQIDQMNAEVEARSERGEYQAVLEVAERAVNEARQWLSEDDPFLGSAINNLAALYFRLGRYEQAEPLFEEVLAQDIRTQGQDHPQNTGSMAWLAEIYQLTGRRDKAEALLIKVLEIRRRWLSGTPQGEALIAMALDNLTAFYRETGQTARADPLQAETDALYSSLPEDIDNHAVQIHRAISLHNSALQDQAEGNYDAAEQKLLQALELKKEHLGAESVGYAETLQAKAALYHTLGRFGEAEQLYQRVLESLKNHLGPQHPEVANTLYHLAAVRIANGGPGEETLKDIIAASQIETDTLGQVFSMRTERERLGYLIEKQGRLARFVSLALLQVGKDNMAARAALDIVLQRKGLVLETQAVLQRYFLSSNDASLRGKFDLIRRMRQNIFSLMSIEDQAAREASMGALFGLYESFEAELVKQVPGSILQEQYPTMNHQQIAWGLLPEGSVLVEIVRIEGFNFSAVKAQGEQVITPAHYLAFILPAQQPEQASMIDLGEAEKIEELISLWRCAVTGETLDYPGRRSVPGHIEDRVLRAGIWNNRQVGSWPEIPKPKLGFEEGTALREAVFDPLLTALGEAKRLFIAPDGKFFLFPYEALPLDEDRYILDEYKISYLNSGRDLFWFGPSLLASKNPALVIADPNYNMGGDALPAFQPDQPFNRLQEVRSEGQIVADRLGIAPWFGDEAVEAALANHPSPAVLHLATHGYFVADLPPDAAEAANGNPPAEPGNRIDALGALFNPLLRSGLALAGANVWAQSNTFLPPDEDGILTAEDILGLDLQGTELVVLSACETGLGEELSGEGVFGLRRAFAIAGAKTLVMSLWKVPDTETLQLMDLFYTNLLEKRMGRAQALRQAQLAMRQQHPKEPFYWGAFICQGDSGRLTEELSRTRP